MTPISNEWAISGPMRGVWRFKQLVERWRNRRALRMAERAVMRFPVVKANRPHALGIPLVVSLTSYPPRFATLERTLRSLLDQSVRPDRTVLWLAGADMPALPGAVSRLQEYGLEIRSCENLRSYKKLIPALELWPDAAIVTADDDVYYPPDWLAGLADAARENPGCIVGHRVHKVGQSQGGKLAPYASWEFATSQTSVDVPGEFLCPTGVGGVLYPPRSLAPTALDSELFMRLAPAADDIWFFWMARLAGREHRGSGRPFRVVPWTGSQDHALYLENWLEGENDRQIKAMEAHFGFLKPTSGSVGRTGHAPAVKGTA